MPDREKIAELLECTYGQVEDRDYDCYGECKICQAERLIANGVGFLPKWIPVTERLPEPNVGVLVYTPRLKNTFEVFYKGNGKWEIVSYRNCEILNDEVTHWMPLPEPPKGD